MSKSKSKRLTKDIQSRIWEQARRDELAGKGVDYDPPCKYKRKRIAAAKRVECWIMKDARAMDVFRDRIRDACDLHLETHLDLRLERHLDLPSDSTERMRWYYCFLAAIHDTDFKGGNPITRDIWPEHLLRYMHLPFWAYGGDKTALIEAALECVEWDLAKTIAPETTAGGNGIGQMGQEQWPQLEDDAYSILTTLADSPTRLKVIEFDGDRRTVGKHLRTMDDEGLVDYKPNAKKGAAITDKGRQFLERKT